MLRHATTGWFIYRISGTDIEALGIYRSEEAAKDDLTVIVGKGWLVKAVSFVGWGDVIFDHNRPDSEPS